MSFGLRPYLLILLALFAIASSVNAVNASSMGAKMATSVMIDATGNAACDRCPGSGMTSSSCDTICVSPVATMLPATTDWRPFSVNPSDHGRISLSVGLPDPPLPHPPRL